MLLKQISRCVIAAGVIYGLSACSQFKVGKSPRAKSQGKATGLADGVCPSDAEGSWTLDDGANTVKFHIVKLDGVLTLNIEQIEGSIYLNGKSEVKTQKAFGGFKARQVELKGECHQSVILVTQKYEDGTGSKSEWRLNGLEAMGNVTITRDGGTEVMVARKDLSAPAPDAYDAGSSAAAN